MPHALKVPLKFWRSMGTVKSPWTALLMGILKPGANFNLPFINLPSLQGDISHATSSVHSHHSLSDFLMSVIPNNFFGVLAGDNLVAVLVLSLIFAVAIRRMKTHREAVVSFFEISSQVFYKVIAIISKLAPLAIFAAFASSISSMGFETLTVLSYFLLSFTLCCLVFTFFLYLIGVVNGISLLKLIKHIREELLIALGTSSSESVFPQMMEKLESFGCGKNIVSFVMPASYAFNLGGTALYVAAACIFLQQVFQIPFTAHDYLILFIFIMIISKGAAGVSGAGFITLSAVLFSLPNNMLPTEQGLALVIGIDPLMSTLRTVVNLIGSALATAIMAKSEKEYQPLKVV